MFDGASLVLDAGATWSQRAYFDEALLARDSSTARPGTARRRRAVDEALAYSALVVGAQLPRQERLPGRADQLSAVADRRLRWRSWRRCARC